MEDWAEIRRLYRAERMGIKAIARHMRVARNTVRDAVRSDDEILQFAREYGATIFHPSGTCKMGSDPMAVTDARLRVHGIGGLRVVDCSIMPTLVSGNTHAPAVMIAEKASDMILADAKSQSIAA